MIPFAIALWNTELPGPDVDSGEVINVWQVMLFHC